jgi:hypothetical protein
VVAFLSGCAPAAPEPAAAAAPDRAALVVTVKAEPKKGWHDPKDDSTYAAMSQIGLAKQFETVDYSALDEIVVWVETQTPDPGPATDLTIVRAQPTLLVAGPGARWSLPAGAYLRTEDGRALNPGNPAVAQVRGFVEVMRESSPEPIARVYVAPSRFVKLAESGKKVTFNDLPPGPAKVVSWHPRLPGSQTTVNLEPGKSTAATLTVGVNTLPKIP